MATEVLMPRQGNTVESCIILSWKVKEGDTVQQGDVLCEVETDKATFEVEAPATGSVLKVLHPEGADVPVLELIAVVGEKGEDVTPILKKRKSDGMQAEDADKAASSAPVEEEQSAPGPGVAQPTAEVAPAGAAPPANGRGEVNISPRARNLAEAKGFDYRGLAGSGPGGRIVERDLQQALGSRPEMTPAAIAELKSAGGAAPAVGTGLGGRVTAADVRTSTRDMQATAAASSADAGAAPRVRGAAGGAFPGPAQEIPVQGIRKRIAERMLGSLQSTAQVTLAMPADAREMLDYRARLKSSDPELRLADVSLNDMVLYAVTRTLVVYPEMNAHFLGDKIVQFERVHLGFAVDTPRGLMVPVIRNADQMSLRDLSIEAKRLAEACLNGKVTSGELAGATFTVSNLGALGIEYFTPVLNPPQVGIVGVGAVMPRPIEIDGDYEFVPQIGLSLTVDHQAVDGAPAARYLRSLAANVAAFDLLLAE